MIRRLRAWRERREFDRAFRRGTPVEIRTPPGGVRVISAPPGCEVNPPQRTWASSAAFEQQFDATQRRAAMAGQAAGFATFQDQLAAASASMEKTRELYRQSREQARRIEEQLRRMNE